MINDEAFNTGEVFHEDNSDNVISFDLLRNNASTRAEISYNKKASAGSEPGLRKGHDVSEPTREEIEAKIAASEARTDAKFADLRGDIKLILQQVGFVSSDLSSMKNDLASIRIDNKATRAAVVSTSIGLFVALIAVGALVATAWYNGTVEFDHLHLR